MIKMEEMDLGIILVLLTLTGPMSITLLTCVKILSMGKGSRKEEFYNNNFLKINRNLILANLLFISYMILTIIFD